MAGDTERIDSLACSPGLVVHKTILGAAASASCTIGDFKRREGPRDRREFLVTLERVRGEGLSIGNDDVRLYCARHKLSEINGAEFLRGAANILLVDAAPSLRLTAAARDALLDGVLWRQEIDPDQVTTLVDSDLGGLMRAGLVKRVFGVGLFRAPLLVFSDFLQVSRMIIQVEAARMVARDTVGASSFQIEDEFRAAMVTFRSRQEESLQAMVSV